MLVPLRGGNPIASDGLSKPAIQSNNILYYWDGTNWVTASYDEDKIVAGNASCIGSSTLFCSGATIPRGAIYSVGNMEAVILYIDEGAVRAAYVDAAGVVHKAVGRFFDANHVLVEPDDSFRTHFGGAARLTDPATGNSKIFVYYSTRGGSVQGMYYETNGAGEGIWSEIYTVIPQDLSYFQIGNVFPYNNKIWMTGRFTRREDFASDSAYTLFTFSTNGIDFSLDRRSLVSLLDYRWKTVYDPVTNMVYFACSNRIVGKPGAYQIAPDTCYSFTYKVKSLSGDPLSGWAASMASGAEVGFEDLWLTEGSFASLSVGVETSLGIEWIPYYDVVVSRVDKAYSDGVRTLQMNLVSDGLWHTGDQSYNLYTEILGKQSVFSPMKQLDVLYAVSGQDGVAWSLSQDMWTSDLPDGYTAVSHNAGSLNDHWGQDLQNILSNYPVFGVDTVYEFNIYGWSRAGVPSQNPNVADTTPTNTPNDQFYALILVEDLLGNQSTIVSTDAQLTSAHGNPAQTWFAAGARAGSYPVTFSIPNPGEGWKILKLGCRVVNTTGATTYFIERVDMPGIEAFYTPTATDAGYVLQAQIAPQPNVNIVENNVTHVTGIYPLPNFTDVTIPYNDGYGDGIKDHILRFITPDDNVTRLYNIHMSQGMYQNGHDYGGSGRIPAIYVQITVGSTVYINSLDTSWAGWAQWFTLPLTTTTVSLAENISVPPNTEVKLEWYYITGENDGIMVFNLAIVTTTSGGSSGSTSLNVPYEAVNNIKGVAQVLFASTPYSAWNFDVIVSAFVTGQYSKVGCIGLATNDANYLIGYIRVGYVGIAKVRDNKFTIVVEQAAAGIIDAADYDIKFWHRDGVFGVEWRTVGSAWPDRGTVLVHNWLVSDGEIAPLAPIVVLDPQSLLPQANAEMSIDEIDAAVFHVGVYSIIDPPKFMSPGFNSAETMLGVMPCDINPVTGLSDFLTLFPSSGRIDINGQIYNYAGKSVYFPSSPIQGPYQFRAVIDWTSCNADLFDSTPYTAWKRAIEFYRFEWKADATYHADFQGAIIATNGQDAWLNDQTFYRPWVTTGGVVVWELERGRFYAQNNAIPAYINPSDSQKVYITNGLTGIVPVNTASPSVIHPEYSFVFIDSDDKIAIKGFFAVSGEDDLTLQILLDKVCKVAGTQANFPGNNATDHLFADGGSITL